jgi:hypothetical protein
LKPDGVYIFPFRKGKKMKIVLQKMEKMIFEFDLEVSSDISDYGSSQSQLHQLTADEISAIHITKRDQNYLLQNLTILY